MSMWSVALKFAIIIPAQAGIYVFSALDSGLRRNDGNDIGPFRQVRFRARQKLIAAPIAAAKQQERKPRQKRSERTESKI